MIILGDMGYSMQFRDLGTRMWLGAWRGYPFRAGIVCDREARWRAEGVPPPRRALRHTHGHMRSGCS
ncbi:hypothetical protein J1TS5_03880 [Paenibacillus macerans]|nr:hypothetical protein J1TS5_03880 [Paenibacillus macerans]